MTCLFRKFQYRISPKVLLVPMVASWSVLCGTVEETQLSLQFALNKSVASDALQALHFPASPSFILLMAFLANDWPAFALFSSQKRARGNAL